ncbi:GIN domain-containing protein [Flavobacterium sp.]|jgi:hypothetical protein|uniref:GIN domain-containing protein n=1 Tax=Flavobacterium sp. TaxID=239 RepID=UPI0022BE05F7|nr:DUF2807 domain-containing protein [Flavobacterium sp.]MCZ8144586.1 DUF2807 domain-containing protein [Flavobacterium sp.]MCZ8366230.1 DUF2807 domain-containing protein [Flavobacterium sp.]
MNRIYLIITLVFTLGVQAQKKEKVKGSKIVTVEQKKIEAFNALEISDNLEVFLIKGNECGLEIEADDNLHDAIGISVVGRQLRLATLKSAFGYKKLSIRVTYTDDFIAVTTKDEAKINALAEMKLETITFTSFDDSKVFVNAQCKKFELIANDHSKSELNVKSDECRINLSKSAQCKALITGHDLTFDAYQKATAEVEGDVENITLRLDNNSGFTGKNLDCKSGKITTESYSRASIKVDKQLTLSMAGKSQLDLYGEPKIELSTFTDSAVLSKKPLK